VLELVDLVRRFGEVLALDHLSFEVPAGSVLGFLGPNGAGKTTAMRAVMGIVDPDHGEIRWKGQPIGDEDRRRFGYMPEERGLYPAMGVAEQITYLARLHGLSRAQAADATERWLVRLGIVERAGDRLEALSLGNQQRVQLAAAFVHGPELLVLDEPFSGLDPVGIDALAAVLAEEAESGATVIFSSHQLDLVEHICERVAIISSGRLVAAGTVRELTAADDRHLTVEVAGPKARTWADRVKGARVVDVDGATLRVVLDPGTDPETVLRAARRAGTLRHFSYARPRLSEVFRRAIHDGDDEATP
jgi:ABC-2 type transport system ATP-binding protein